MYVLEARCRRKGTSFRFKRYLILKIFFWDGNIRRRCNFKHSDRTLSSDRAWFIKLRSLDSFLRAFASASRRFFRDWTQRLYRTARGVGPRGSSLAIRALYLRDWALRIVIRPDTTFPFINSCFYIPLVFYCFQTFLSKRHLRWRPWFTHSPLESLLNHFHNPAFLKIGTSKTENA